MKPFDNKNLFYSSLNDSYVKDDISIKYSYRKNKQKKSTQKLKKHTKYIKSGNAYNSYIMYNTHHDNNLTIHNKLTTEVGSEELFEPFTDMNGNNIWDPAESFTDKNNNTKYDHAEDFVDINNNGKYDIAEKYIDNNHNDLWDSEEEYIDKGNGSKYLLCCK